MNIFENYLKSILEKINHHYKELGIKKIESYKGINLEKPPSNFDCDISSNVVLILAKQNKCNPITLGNNIKKLLEKNIKDFKNIEIAGPGFLNITLKNDAITLIINNILKKNEKFGSQKDSKNYNIEFVSANPTGPMHVGHCRGAIFGDTLSNLLKFNGNKVTKEYYINDYGNQIKNFVESVHHRIIEIKEKKPFPNKENLYPGEYIKDIAKDILNENKELNLTDFDENFEFLKNKSLEASMNLIKDDLKKLGISHDNFLSETDIVNKNMVDKAINNLKEKNYVEEGYLDPPKGENIKDWKKVKRLIFKSTLFGDDTDRALQKNDGSWTYFANDIAYHMDKVDRKYDNLINILGADHTGYIKRIKSAVSALSDNKTLLDCKVCQLVKLYKNGQPFKMSKRAGEFISAQDLLDEVEKDPIRFMMLNRSNDVELDFDFDKVKEKNKDNPVFYVQYAYARINSILRSLKIKFTNKVELNDKDFQLNEIEQKILRKVFEWPKIIESACNKFDLHKIPVYLYDLATLFHSYWSKGNEDEKYKFIKNEKIKRNEIFAIMNLIAIVLQNGMGILGVSLPDKM